MPAWQTSLTFALLALVFVGLARGRSADALLIAAVVVCGAVGILTPKEAFSGFSNEGMLTVAALYVVAAGLRETGALGLLGRALLGRAKTELGVLARMAAGITTSSAFLNNTPIVLMGIPVIIRWCKEHKIAPSRLLLPLSYLSILGGTCTLIGTSTNLVLNGLMTEKFAEDPDLFVDLAPMTLFEMSAVGIPYALAGIAYLLLAGRHILPSRQDFLSAHSQRKREYLANMRIEPDCQLVGKSVKEAGLRRLPGLFLAEIMREKEFIIPVPPDQVLQAGDILTFTGAVETMVDLQAIPGLIPWTETADTADLRARRGAMLCEAVVSSAAPILGKSIRESNFRSRYGAVVIAVHRGNERLRGRLGDVVFRNGDTLLLETGPHFIQAHRNNPDFHLVSGVEDSRPVRHNKALLSLGLLGVLVFLMTTGWIPIVMAAFLVAGLLVGSRCISVSDARQSVDLQTLITICAALGFGQALVNAGCVDLVTSTVRHWAGEVPPIVLLIAVYLLTTCFAGSVTNVAAAAIMFPFAIEIAMGMGLSPRPFCMAVAFAASASFVSPLGYQTNIMVYGPGGYRLSDFIKVGLPLTLILMLVAVLLIPLRWPF
jgi:di/tricarboxylate transporter